MNLQLIKKVCENRTGGLKQLASDIKMSEANLHRCLNKNDIKASDLEIISLKLKTSIVCFFDEGARVITDNNAVANGDCSIAAINSQISTNDNFHLNEKIKYLQDMVSEKERLIQILMTK